MHGIVFELCQNNIILYVLVWEALHRVSPERREDCGLGVGKTGLILDLKCSSCEIACKFLNSVESQLPHLYKWGSYSPYKVMKRIQKKPAYEGFLLKNRFLKITASFYCFLFLLFFF